MGWLARPRSFGGGLPHIRRDLAPRHVQGLSAVMNSAIPAGGFCDRACEAPLGAPAEQTMGLVAGEMEQRCFVRRVRIRLVHDVALAPSRGGLACQVVDGADRMLVRPEVPGTGKSLRVARQGGTELEITIERIEHVLPWPCCLGVSQDDRFARLECSNGVRNDAILRAVAAADNIAGARARGSQAVTAQPERVVVGPESELGARFRSGIRVAPTEFVILAITP